MMSMKRKIRFKLLINVVVTITVPIAVIHIRKSRRFFTKRANFWPAVRSIGNLSQRRKNTSAFRFTDHLDKKKKCFNNQKPLIPQWSLLVGKSRSRTEQMLVICQIRQTQNNILRFLLFAKKSNFPKNSKEELQKFFTRNCLWGWTLCNWNNNFHLQPIFLFRVNFDYGYPILMDVYRYQRKHSRDLLSPNLRHQRIPHTQKKLKTIKNVPFPETQ